MLIKAWNAHSVGCYLHVCHDLVQEDTVHQLHEHVDPLLWAYDITWTQRTQRPHLETERKFSSVRWVTPCWVNQDFQIKFNQVGMSFQVTGHFFNMKTPSLCFLRPVMFQLYSKIVSFRSYSRIKIHFLHSGLVLGKVLLSFWETPCSHSHSDTAGSCPIQPQPDPLATV